MVSGKLLPTAIPTCGSAPGQALSKYRPTQPLVTASRSGWALAQMSVARKWLRLGLG